MLVNECVLVSAYAGLFCSLLADSFLPAGKIKVRYRGSYEGCRYTDLPVCHVNVRGERCPNSCVFR